MRVLLQRVSEASVSVDGEVVGQIGPGLAVLVGVKTGDAEAEARYLAEKTANLRIFADAEGKFNLSAREVSAGVLVVSQFTLYADAKKGRRPSFSEAAAPGVAEALVEAYARHLEAYGLRVARGRFGAHMLVRILNDGPVTISLEA